MKLNKGLNILIINAHWDNRGDEAAIRAMIDSFRSDLPINNMKIMIFSQNVTQFPYADIELVDLYPSGIIAHLDSILTLITFGKMSFTCSGRKFINAVNEADVIIHAPGGPGIGNIYGKGLAGYHYLYRLLFSKVIKNKLVFLYAPSIGPFSKNASNIIRKFLLKKIDPIILREDISARYLKEQLGLDSLVTIDSAFQNDIPNAYIDKYADSISHILNTIENKKVVGITITDLKWHPVYRDYTQLSEKIMNSLSETIEFLISRDYTILLIPQLFGEQSDVPLLENFRKINKEQIFILPEYIDSYAQQVIISKLFCVIGMRYHSNIFSAKGNVPFISIYYEHKMKGFMENIGLAELLINVEEINAGEIIDKYLYLEQNYGFIKNVLEKWNPQLKQKSKMTTEIIIEKLNSTILDKSN